MSLFRRYRGWAHAHSGSIAAVEGVLSSLTWLLPDRFSESELALEGVHSLLGLSSLCHDRILSAPPDGPLPPQLPWPFLLAALQQVEVLVEMGSNSLERQGKANKYTPLAVLEAIKVLLRMLILRQSGARLLADGGLSAGPPAQKDPDAKLRAVCGALARFHRRHCLGGGVAAPPGAPEVSTASAAHLSTDRLTARDGQQGASSAGSKASTSGRGGFWWERTSSGLDGTPAASPRWRDSEALEQHRVLQAHAQWTESAGRHLLVFAETTYVMRSLLYVLALRRWGRRSWRPWALSLALEAASAHLMSLAAAAARGPQRKKGLASPSCDSLGILQSLQTFKWSPAEQREMVRRRLLFLYYLIKSPFFDTFTGRAIALSQQALRPLPVVGSLADKAAEIVFGVQQYYTYTNAS